MIRTESLPLPEAQLRAAWELARHSPFEGWAALFNEQSTFDNWSARAVTHAAAEAHIAPQYPRLQQLGENLIVQESDLTVWAIHPDGSKEVLF